MTPRLEEGAFDGILFDTYPLCEEQLRKNHFQFFKEAYGLLKNGGLLTYCSEEAKRFSRKTRDPETPKYLYNTTMQWLYA